MKKINPFAIGFLAIIFLVAGCTTDTPVEPAPTPVVTETPSPTPQPSETDDDVTDAMNSGVVVPLEAAQGSIEHEGETYEVPEGATEARFKQGADGVWAVEFTFPVTDDELGSVIDGIDQG